MGVLRRISASEKGGSEQSKAALAELRQKIEKDVGRGTSSPTASTPGNIFYNTGATKEIWVKVEGTWTQIV